MIDPETLARAAQIPADRAAFWSPHLSAAFATYDIDTPRRIAAFLAQAKHETQGFTKWVESLSYSSAERIASVYWSAFKPSEGQETDIEDMLDAGQINEGQAAAERKRIAIENARPYVRSPERLANRAYAFKLGNRDEASGDGWRYRGRGLLQITGFWNYSQAQAGVGLPLVEKPEMLEDPEYAALVSGWRWHNDELNDLADAGAIDRITRAINGKAMLGRAERAEAFRFALEAL